MAQIKTFDEILIEKTKKGEVTIIPVNQHDLKKFEDYMAERRREFNVKSFYSRISAANTILTV